jgi:hypothetical protein
VRGSANRGKVSGRVWFLPVDGSCQKALCGGAGTVRHAATRPVLDTLIAARTPHRGRIPKGWTDPCAVDANGAPTTER